jgi:hypothetical protein
MAAYLRSQRLHAGIVAITDGEYARRFAGGAAPGLYLADRHHVVRALSLAGVSDLRPRLPSLVGSVGPPGG